jgi:hypothetical protein
MVEHRWQALTPGEAAAVFDRLGKPWWIAGGWAIDLALGRQTRPHADIDIAFLRRDVAALRSLAASWELCIAHEGSLLPWDGGDLLAQHHQFWARAHGSEDWAFEILLEQIDAGHWAYRRDARITMPLAAIGRVTDDGISYVAAPIALLYKSGSSTRARDEGDFRAALPLLSDMERAWLRDALVLVDVTHPWIALLD